MNLMAAAVIAMTLLASVVVAQSAGVAGNWEGKIVSPQGERPMSATFKKEGDGYTGTVNQMMRDVTLQDVKVDGNKVTAKANIDTGQATITINYKLTLDGDNLKGTGDLDLADRASPLMSSLSALAPRLRRPLRRGNQQRLLRDRLVRPDRHPPDRRPLDRLAVANRARGRGASPPQPMQKQSADYFVGT
jgi:hypothetical protein